MHLSSDFIIGFRAKPMRTSKKPISLFRIWISITLIVLFIQNVRAPAAELEDTTPEQVKKSVWPKFRSGLNSPVFVKQMLCSVQSSAYWLRKFLIKIRMFWWVQQTIPVMSPLLVMHRGRTLCRDRNHRN